MHCELSTFFGPLSFTWNCFSQYPITRRRITNYKMMCFQFLFLSPSITYSSIHPVLDGWPAGLNHKKRIKKSDSRESFHRKCGDRNIRKLHVQNGDTYFLFLRMMFCLIYIDFKICYKGRMRCSICAIDCSYKLDKRCF